MLYPIVIHKDKDSDYGVTVPDLPGCVSAGSTLADALTQAVEAIREHIELLTEDNCEIPRPGTIQEHRESGIYEDAYLWRIVEVDFLDGARARRSA